MAKNQNFRLVGDLWNIVPTVGESCDPHHEHEYTFRFFTL